MYWELDSRFESLVPSNALPDNQVGTVYPLGDVPTTTRRMAPQGLENHGVPDGR